MSNGELGLRRGHVAMLFLSIPCASQDKDVACACVFVCVCVCVCTQLCGVRGLQCWLSCSLQQISVPNHLAAISRSHALCVLVDPAACCCWLLQLLVDIPLQCLLTCLDKCWARAEGSWTISPLVHCLRFDTSLFWVQVRSCHVHLPAWRQPHPVFLS